MRILGIIPARGGSKGLPGKNIRLLSGIPLLNYTASVAKASSLSKVVLSSDDEAIVRVAREIELESPFIRPACLSTDSSTTLEVIKHALTFFEEAGESFDAICLLQVTYPFRTDNLINSCIVKFIESKAETLFTTVTVPNHFNPHWVFEQGKRQWLQLATKDKAVIPSRQLLPKAYIRDGAIYIVQTEVIMKKNTLYGKKITHVETDRKWYVNIDSEDDWQKAERIAPIFLNQYSIN